MNKKFFLAGAMAASLSLNCSGQNCVKFIDYQNKTIDTKGLNMKLFGQPVGVGATSVTPLYREVGDQVQKLDLLQYNICEQLKNIKTDFMREKLQAQYTNMLMKMMELCKLEGQPETSATTVANTAAEEAVVPTPTPTPTPTPAPEPAVIPPAGGGSLDDVLDVEVNFPCFGDAFFSNNGMIRASGMESSMDAQIAKRAARTVALEELASKIEITVNSVTEDHFIRTQNGMNEEIQKKIEGTTKTSVNKTLTGYKTACEKFTQNRETKKYSCYMALEISEENALKPVYEELQKDAALKKALPTYDKFKQTFNEVMKTFEDSF